MIKIIEFKDLTPLEEELLNKAPTGEDIGQMLLPDEGDASKRVRASLLRALLLGDLDGVSLHPKGASMRGAWIDGDLDFEGCELSHPVKLVLCRFSGEVIFLDAHVPALYLPGSHVGHLNLHRLRSDGVVHLRKGFRASAGVNLGGAQISGQLDCNRGHFENANGIALKCTVMTVGEDVLFCDGFKAVGEVSLLRAQISGQLACDDGHFENANGIALDCEAMSVGADVLLRDGFKVQGKLDLVRARTTGNLRIEKSEINGEVDLESARVDEGFFWKDISGAVTTLDLTDMSVGVLRDEKASWECVQQKHFKGFRYDRMDTSIRVSERLKMLAPNTAEISKFNPQPHTQFAKVLTDAGYRNGAARVRFEREEHLRRYSREVIEMLGLIDGHG